MSLTLERSGGLARLSAMPAERTTAQPHTSTASHTSTPIATQISTWSPAAVPPHPAIVAGSHTTGVPQSVESSHRSAGSPIWGSPRASRPNMKPGVHALRWCLAALLAACCVAPAALATDRIALSRGNGPDPAFIDALREVPGPSGGPAGHPLVGRARARATAADVRASLPQAWCGAASPTNDGTDELANGTPKYHAIYTHASDAPDRLVALASTLQTDALQASALLETLYGRAIRYDMGTTCGSQYLDISDVALPQSTAQLQAAATGGGLLDILRSDLTAAGYAVAPDTDSLSAARARHVNFLLWLDGPVVSGVCGQATLYADASNGPDNINAYGGKLAVIYRDGQGFCGSNAVRHEIGHTLGALMPMAPHAFDGAHCDDAYEDTMCYPQSPKRTGGDYEARFFDYGNDDYWALPGHSLGHWTVDQSPFLCPDVSCNVPGGSASGTTLDTDGDGIPDAIDRCPTVSDAVQELDPTGQPACAATRDAPLHGSTIRSGAPAKRTLTIRLRHRGRYRIVVRCGRRTVLRRVVRAPRRVVVRVRCASRPRARVSRV